jgi:hypothetical protein
LNNAFGKEFAAANINVRFPIVNDLEICEIDIKAGKIPWYCEVVDKNGSLQKKFYIRSGNSSQELDIQETASFIKNRF